jgi:hypothetical protein
MVTEANERNFAIRGVHYPTRTLEIGYTPQERDNGYGPDGYQIRRSLRGGGSSKGRFFYRECRSISECVFGIPHEHGL